MDIGIVICSLFLTSVCADIVKFDSSEASEELESILNLNEAPLESKTNEEEQCISCDNETKIICYFTNWAWYREGYGQFLPSNIDPKLCTHVIYAFAVLDNETYTIKSYDTWTDIENGFYSLVTSLRDFGVKVSLAIGGWNDSEGDKYSILVNNETLRKNFIKHSVDFLLEYNFTGLELNWEYPVCWQGNCSAGPQSDYTNFGVFVKELHLAYRDIGLTLSAAVAAGKSLTDQCYDVPTLSCYLDWINIMHYDFASFNEKHFRSNSPFYADHNDSVVVSARHWEARGAAKCKINIGIPSYGRNFNLTNCFNHNFGAPVSGTGIAGSVTNITGVLSYQEICLLVKHSGWTVESSWANGAIAYNNKQMATFVNVYDCEIRAGFVKTDKYGGIFVYNLDYDDFNNVCGCGTYPLLTTINKVIRGDMKARVQCY